MVKFKSFLKLIRAQNLIIVALTMVLMRYAIIEPILGLLPFIERGASSPEVMQLQFRLLDFIILVLSTVSITAAGYVINDYFDIRTDLLNRGKVIVGTKIARRRAMMWHNVLNLLGIIGGFYVSFRIGFVWLGILFMLISGLLYFYSATYKRQFLLGNIIVSILTAAVPFMVVVFEVVPVYAHYSANAATLSSMNILFYWVGGFSLFAFLSTLAREIVKDMEDFEGDKAYGSNSIPVVLGLKGSSIIVSALIGIIIVLLGIVWFEFLNDTITLCYFGLAIVLPLLIALFYCLRTYEQKDLHRASVFLKIIMLTGICYSGIVYFVISREVIL